MAASWCYDCYDSLVWRLGGSHPREAGSRRVHDRGRDQATHQQGSRLAAPSAKPGPIREHCVEVDGVVHPIKEAFSRVTGLDVLDFNTNQARSVFKRLGFRVMRSH